MTALLSLLRQAMAKEGSAAGAGAGRITMETVASVRADGKHEVLGRALPVTGLRTYRAGDLVPVAWRNGVPVAVIGHRWRRAQFHPSARIVARGIVEELLVGNFDETAPDVWYRNHEKLIKLDIARFLQTRQPQVARWGLDGNSFAVQCSDGTYAIFTLDRADPNVMDEQAPGTPTLLSLSAPLESNQALVTVTFSNQHTVAFTFWLGETRQTTAYVKCGYGVPWYPFPEYWKWCPILNVTTRWDGSDSGSGTASVNSQQAFGLKDLLGGAIRDFNNESRVVAEVLDWYLDADLALKFLIRVAWDYFVVGTAQNGTGTVQYPYGSGLNGMEAWEQEVAVGGTATGVIGAKRKSDQQTVDEQHVFLWDGKAQAVIWATAANSVTQRLESHDFFGRIYDHVFSSDPGYPGGGNPPLPPGEPSSSEIYYGGANYRSLPVPTYSQNLGFVGQRRMVLSSDPATFQLFDPLRLSVLQGPYITDVQGGEQFETRIIGASADWVVRYMIQTNQIYRLWHYRVATAQVFQVNQEVRLFLVLERYPFFAGTNFIDDIPQVGIFIIEPNGILVRILRSFQYGVAGASLISGNAHRILWTLTATGAGPTISYRVTDLDIGAEQSFTPTQVATFLQGRARLFSPDFLWDRIEPQVFYEPAALPALTEEEILRDYATLVAAEGAPEGSVRMVNDEAILSPLDRYRAT